VQVVCNTTGQSGVSVNLAGPGTFADTTDSSGSVFFGYIPTGNYTVTAQDSGIDRNGATPPSKQASVVGGTSSTLTLDDCDPGALRVKFDTKRLADSAPKPSRDKFGFSLGNSGLPAPAFRSFFIGAADIGDYGEQLPAPGPSDGTAFFTATSLYPFSPEAYSAWAGNCFAERPDQLAPGGTVVQQLITPGDTAGPITLRQPSVNVVVKQPNGTISPGSRVRATAKSAGCAGTVDLGVTNAAGQLDDPGLPYGIYDICADKNPGNSKIVMTNVRVDNPNGTATLTFQLPNSGGVYCP
jgi:hypothetical protein